MTQITVHVSKSHKNTESAKLVEAIYLALGTLKKKNVKVYIEKNLGEADAPYIIDAGKKIVGTFKSLAKYVFQGPQTSTAASVTSVDSLANYQKSQLFQRGIRSEPSDEDDDNDVDARRNRVALESARRTGGSPLTAAAADTTALAATTTAKASSPNDANGDIKKLIGAANAGLKNARTEEEKDQMMLRNMLGSSLTPEQQAELLI